jgi:hypothetical protein
MLKHLRAGENARRAFSTCDASYEGGRNAPTAGACRSHSSGIFSARIRLLKCLMPFPLGNVPAGRSRVRYRTRITAEGVSCVFSGRLQHERG